MASMTTEFFKVRLIKRAGKEELDYRLLGELLEGILAQHAVQNENYRSIDLSPKTEPDSADPKEVMDLFEDDKYLFGRLCRKKANNAVLKRNYETLEAENVFDGSEARKRGIEEFTEKNGICLSFPADYIISRTPDGRNENYGHFGQVLT